MKHYPEQSKNNLEIFLIFRNLFTFTFFQNFLKVLKLFRHLSKFSKISSRFLRCFPPKLLLGFPYAISPKFFWKYCIFFLQFPLEFFQKFPGKFYKISAKIFQKLVPSVSLCFPHYWHFRKTFPKFFINFGRMNLTS